jgi:hypothetical protein
MWIKDPMASDRAVEFPPITRPPITLSAATRIGVTAR